jgi:hypothetical protein
VLTNDPAPHYAHQSNLAEDGVLYPVIEDVLSAYRARFADNAPIVEPTMTESGLAFARSAAWGPARAATTAYLDSTGVHVTGAPAGVQVPVTVPTGSTGALNAYAGELSNWLPSPVNLTVPDVGYLPGPRPAAPTGVTGVAGNRSVTLSWTPPAVPAGRSSATGYRITAFIGSTAQAPVDTGNVTKNVAVNGLSNGTTYRFTVAARNQWGIGPASAASAAVTPTARAAAAGGGLSTASQATIAKVSRLAMKSKATFSWTTRNSAGVTGYQVFVRRATFGKALPTKWRLLRTVTSRSAAIAMSPGQSLVVAIRPVASAGQSTLLSAPSVAVSQPLGARSMRTSKGWKTLSKKSYFGGAALASTRRGASLRLPKTTRVRQFALLAAVGKRAGTVNVFVGGRRVATVSLAAKKAAGQKVLFFRPSQVRSGKVVLKVGSTNRPVRIQGLAVFH